MSRRDSNRSTGWVQAGVVLAVIVAAAAWTIAQEFRNQTRQAESMVQAVSALSARDVQAWVERQMTLAQVLDDSIPLAEQFVKSQDDADPQALATLLARSIQFRKSSDADAALILDASGEIVAHERAQDSATSPEMRAAVTEAVQTGRPVHTSIYRSDDASMPVRMDVAIPLLNTGHPARGLMVFRVDPRRTMFANLTAWPVPSHTGESVLWERVGDRITNISSPLKVVDGVRKFSEPIAGSEMALPRVLRGESQLLQPQEAKDYRHTDVVAVVHEVPGTAWWIVAKIDRKEVEDPAWDHARATIVAAILALIGLALASRLLTQRRSVAELKREHREQRERSQTLRLLEAIADGASDSIFAKDLEGRYVFYNRAAARALGKTPADVVGQDDVAIFGAATAGMLRSNDARILKTRMPEAFEETIRVNDRDLTLLATKAPLIDAEGELFGVLGVSRDVTEWRRAELDLKEHRKQLEQLVAQRTGELVDVNRALESAARFNQTLTNAMPGRVVYWTADRRCKFANQAFADWFGTTPEKLIGAHAEDVHDKAYLDYIEPEVEAALQGRTLMIIRETTDYLGRRLSHEVHYIPDVGADGTVLGFCAIGYEITRLKQAEESLQLVNDQLAQSRDEAASANIAKTAFLANMSHEIRTPMNAIIGLTGLMTRDAKDPSQRDRLAKVSQAAQHLLGVINNILDLSKIEAGKLLLENAEFALDSVLTRATAMVAARAAEKGLELIVDPDHLPKRLRGDATRLSQILINLLSNAVKFTETGWVRLRCHQLEENATSIKARFAVQDTGPGIPLELQGRLFSPFEQADNSISRHHSGTGLGLALTRELARTMGGDAGMISSPGAGSTFWVDVWLERSELAADARSAASDQDLRVLVVDDLPEARVVMAALLTELGFEVDDVSDGLSAVSRVQAEIAARRPFDALLIDWQMTPLDGFQTLERLRAILGDETPPSILVTGFDETSVLGRARAAGFDAVLGKPYTMSSLQDTLSSVLHRTSMAHTEPGALATPQEDVLRARHAGQRILLAEDNPVNREVAEELLQNAGLVVETAWDGARAVELARTRNYDLILMDMQMPLLDGLQATRAIRELIGSTLPILAMTANAFVEDRLACLEAGMDDHVAKPVDPEALYATLLRWLPMPRRIAPQPTSAPAASAQSRPDLQGFVDRLAVIDEIDVAISLRTVHSQPAALERMIRTFVEVYRDGLPALHAGFDGRHETQLKWHSVCHSVRGAVSTIGSAAIQRQIDALEADLAAMRDPRAISSKGQALHEALVALVASLDSALDDQRV